MHVRQAQTLQKRVCSKIRGIHVHPSQAEALNSRFMIDDLIKFSGTFFISSFVILYFHIDTLFWIVFKNYLKRVVIEYDINFEMNLIILTLLTHFLLFTY